jgi:hypothetical protein
LTEKITLTIDDEGLLAQIENAVKDKRFSDPRDMLLLILKREFATTGHQVAEAKRLLNAGGH